MVSRVLPSSWLGGTDTGEVFSWTPGVGVETKVVKRVANHRSWVDGPTVI